MHTRNPSCPFHFRGPRSSNFRLRVLAAFTLTVVTLGITACDDSASPEPESEARDGGLPDSGPLGPQFTLKAPSELSTHFEPTGENASFIIEAVRQAPFNGEIGVTLEGLPAHVGTSLPLPLFLAGTDDSFRIAFVPDEFALYGSAPVKLVAQGGGTYAEHTLTLNIQHGRAALDSTFGNLGVAMPVLGHPAVSINAVAVQPDGKWILAGSTGTGRERDVLVARLLADGAPDTSFGTRGVVVTDVCGNDDSVDAVTVQSDGRIVVAGGAMAADCSGTASQSLLFARYTTTGALDTTFGGTGVRTFNHSTGIAAMKAVGIDSKGRIVGAGTVRNGSLDMAVMRLTAAGAPDTSFSDDGLSSANVGGDDEGLAMVILGDDGIIVAGASTNSANTLTLTRYNVNGTVDSQYNYSPSFTSPKLTPKTLRLLPDGKLLVGGRAEFDDSSIRAFVARMSANANEDTSFNGDGYRFFNAGETGVSDTVVGLGVLAGGEIAVVSQSKNNLGKVGIGVTHLSATGATRLRSHRTDLPGNETPTAALLDAEGFLRVVGLLTPEGQSSAAPFAARYWPY